MPPARRPAKAALLWNLKWGKDYEWLRERFDEGFDTPAIENKPDISADIHYLLTMWNTLAGSRPSGMAEVPAVPISEIVATFIAFKVNEFCLLDEFVEWMQFLDGAAREYWNEKNNPDKKRPMIILTDRDRR